MPRAEGRLLSSKPSAAARTVAVVRVAPTLQALSRVTAALGCSLSELPDRGPFPCVAGVEVREGVLIEVHGDHDAVEGADPGHVRTLPSVPARPGSDPSGGRPQDSHTASAYRLAVKTMDPSTEVPGP